MGDRSPSIVPSNAERDIYLVLEDFGQTGRAWRETDEADTDRATLIQHLFEGQYTNPVRIVSSRETFEIGVWSIIRLCLQPPSHRARRPSPERYLGSDSVYASGAVLLVQSRATA